MDWSSLGGLVLALIGILFGQAIEGGKIGSLIQPAAFIIVMCGTFGAVLLQTNTSSFVDGLKMVRQVFTTPIDDRQELFKRISLWSNFARKEGIFMLEPYMKKEKDPFIQKGLKIKTDEVEFVECKLWCFEKGHICSESIFAFPECFMFF